MTQLDFYQSFDKDFFHPKRWRTTGAEAEEEIRQTAERYSQLLRHNMQMLDAVLENKSPPEELSEEFYHELESLVELERFEFAKIRKRGDSVPFLIKADDLAKEAGVSLNKGQEGYVCGRIVAHLCRLMMPKTYYHNYTELAGKAENKSCRSFAKDFVRYASLIEGDEMELSYKSDTLRQNINIEGEGTFVFWTIAPYVALELQQHGKTPMESIQAIFGWAEQGNANNMKHTNFWDLNVMITSKPLGFDERMPTHLRARIAAKMVAREL